MRGALAGFTAITRLDPRSHRVRSRRTAVHARRQPALRPPRLPRRLAPPTASGSARRARGRRRGGPRRRRVLGRHRGRRGGRRGRDRCRRRADQREDSRQRRERPAGRREDGRRRGGLDVTWVNFDDWTLPNSALVAGEVDANAFQHTAFLSAYNVANDTDLTPVFSTTITQWGVFSATLDSLDDIGEGARIAIPDDASNGARALFILQAAGLIELGPDVGVYPTVDDVTENDLGLEFVPIGATTIPTQFDDPSLDAVVVGTSYFDPSQEIDADDALYLDDSLSEESRPYVNAVVTRADDADDEAWDLLADAYADPRVAAALEEESFGNTVLVDVSADDLRSTLGELETAARELNS
nr:hypothetical protein GCM10025699_77450 [Microbacterium flavescens]